MPQEPGSNPQALSARPDVGMTNQTDVASVLQTHDPKKLPVPFQTPETNTFLDLLFELFKGHVRFTPTVNRNDAPIRLSTIVDDLKDGVQIRLVASPYHSTPPPSSTAG